MKNSLVSVITFICCLHGPTAIAQEAEMDHGQALKGPGIGALAGGLLAGPPGILAGLIGGALIAEIEIQKDRAQAAGRALDEAMRGTEVLRQIQQSQARLEAVAEGFSFCLRFRTESAAIEPGLEPHLRALVVMLNAFPELDIEVRATTDRRGSDGYNLELARLRADAVVGNLVEVGLSRQRIKLKISGERMAVHPENDPEGLGFDRYVIVSFVAGDAS